MKVNDENHPHPDIGLSLITCGIAAASDGQKPDPFAAVPSSQRERLKSRLAEFVDYHRAKHWSRAYDLLAERDKNSAVGGLSRDRFLKDKLYSRVREFTPKSVQKMDNDWWISRAVRRSIGVTPWKLAWRRISRKTIGISRTSGVRLPVLIARLGPVNINKQRPTLRAP